ncbi:MAG: signal peptidase I [Bryobacteraceae bacterium]
MDESSAPAGRSQPKPYSGLLAWVRDLVLAVGLALVVILFIYQPVQVEGTSMMPSLEDQERIFISKFVYRLGIEEIRRGDTVVFYFPADPRKSYIKRIIGVPGDRVKIQQGQVYVNGIALQEDYIPAAYRDSGSMSEVLVPPDSYFVLGDHRTSSNDSRHWGFLPRRNIYGKAVFVYWPLDKMGPVR